MQTPSIQSQIFLQAFHALPLAERMEVFQILKEEFESQTDFWDALSEQEKEDIKAGLSDIELGNIISDDIVKVESRKWLEK